MVTSAAAYLEFLKGEQVRDLGDRNSQSSAVQGPGSPTEVDALLLTLYILAPHCKECWSFHLSRQRATRAQVSQ